MVRGLELRLYLNLHTTDDLSSVFFPQYLCLSLLQQLCPKNAHLTSEQTVSMERQVSPRGACTREARQMFQYGVWGHSAKETVHFRLCLVVGHGGTYQESQHWEGRLTHELKANLGDTVRH